MFDRFAYLIELRKARDLELLEIYKARLPIKSKELPPEYVVTEDNPNPPLLHYSIPIKDQDVLYDYAAQHGGTCLDPLDSSKVSGATIVKAVEILGEEVNYKLTSTLPFGPTADCRLIIVLYDNLDFDTTELTDEEEEDLIQSIKSELGLDESVKPAWYFNFDDPYQPDDSD